MKEFLANDKAMGIVCITIIAIVAYCVDGATAKEVAAMAIAAIGGFVTGTILK